MYESFGAHVDGQAVEFRLFLPDATVDPTQYTNTTGDPRLTEIRVAGDFQRHLGGHDWDLTSAPVLARGTPSQRGGLHPPDRRPPRRFLPVQVFRHLRE